MKKLFSIIMMIAALTFSVSAKGNKENKHQEQVKKTHMEVNIEQSARHMAKQLDLDEKATEKFIPLYKSYREDKKSVMQKYAEKHKNTQLMTDEDIAKSNKNSFAEKREMLDLEESYYKKFTKIMNERQYSVMKKMGMRGHGRNMQRARRQFGKAVPMHNNHNRQPKHHQNMIHKQDI